MYISQDNPDTAVATAVAATTGTKSSSGNHACAANADTAALVSMRGGQPNATAGPSIGTTSGAAAAKSATEVKNPKHSADPLNVVVVNPGFKEDRWGTHKAHWIPM